MVWIQVIMESHVDLKMEKDFHKTEINNIILLFPINNVMTRMITLSHSIMVLVTDSKTLLFSLQLNLSLKNGIGYP